MADRVLKLVNQFTEDEGAPIRLKLVDNGDDTHSLGTAILSAAGVGLATEAKQDTTNVHLTTLTQNSKKTDAYGIQAISEDDTYKYYWFEADDARYYIMRKHKENKVFDYTAGTGGYADVYQSPILGPDGSPTWGDRGVIF